MWLAKFKGPTGTPVEARVVVKDSEGTWTGNTSSPFNPCFGLEWPFAVTRAAADNLEISVNMEKALSGCGTFDLKLKRTDDKTLEGEFSDGRKVILSRQ